MKKLEKSAKAWALTAHRLRDGIVVYRPDSGGWTERVEDAARYLDKDEAETAEAAAAADVAAREVIAPYLIEIAPDETIAAPVSVREQIRSLGPTVRTDLGKQALNT